MQSRDPEECHDHRVGVNGFWYRRFASPQPIEGCGWRCLRFGLGAAAVRRGPVTIVLIDDHAILRQGLRSLLERELDLQVVGEASSAWRGTGRRRADPPDDRAAGHEAIPGIGQRRAEPVRRADQAVSRAQGAGALHLRGRRTGGQRHSARGMRLRGQGCRHHRTGAGNPPGRQDRERVRLPLGRRHDAVDPRPSGTISANRPRAERAAAGRTRPEQPGHRRAACICRRPR